MKQRYYSRHAQVLLRELNRVISREELKKLHHKNPWRHGALLARQYALLILCYAGIVNINSWWFWIPASALLGLTIFNFTVLLHEVLHHCVFNEIRPKTERLLSLLYAIPSGISPTQFTRWHLDHHAELGSMDDPKRNHLSPKKNSRLLKILYATPFLFVIYFRAAAKETATYEKQVQRTIRLERFLALCVHVVAAIVLYQFFGLSVLTKAYILPVFIFFPIAFAINRMGQHYHIDSTDPAKWSTLIQSNACWNWIFIYSNLHLEHHYFPGVPCYNLPKLQRLLHPYYKQKGMSFLTYPQLFKGWILHNGAPHTKWNTI